MFLLGHISLLPLVVLSCWDIMTRCHANTLRDHNKQNDNLLADLMFSDTNHQVNHHTNLETQFDNHAAQQQQVLYIDHGGGAVSHIRRSSFHPTPLSPLSPLPLPSPPSQVTNNNLPLSHQPITPSFAPNVDQYPNHIFDGGFGDSPNFFNYPNHDIPRLFQRRVGENNKQRVIARAAPSPAQQPTQAPPLPLPIQPKVEEKMPLIPPSHPPSHPPTIPTPQFLPQNSPFFNFASPDLFPFIDGPFSPLAPPPLSPLFQRRRLTVNNNNNNNQINDFHPNAIGGYPSYTYYKGGEDNLHVTNWPKIFKFTDGRANLSEFEKQKKHGKIKFTSKDDYFDNISRDSFLILHGGTFTN